jgi:hypothetical protein
MNLLSRRSTTILPHSHSRRRRETTVMIRENGSGGKRMIHTKEPHVVDMSIFLLSTYQMTRPLE